MEKLINLASKYDEGGAAAESSVVHLVPRSRTVPPMTDDEVTEMRAMLTQWKQVLRGCPIARKAVKE